MPELKPCPFCGNRPGLSIRRSKIYYIKCMNSGCWIDCKTIPCFSEEEATEAWNKRDTPKEGR